MITVVAAIAIGGTIAYFNDTETSTGNIFVAGSIDLKVDHTAQTYNGVDCKTCDVTVVSDTSDTVIEKDGVAVNPYSAVLAWIHPVWTAQNDPSLLASSAQWIWEQNPTQQADTIIDTSYSFKKEFVWMGPIASTDLFMAVGSDNGVQVYLNTVLIGSNTGEFGYLQGSMLQIPAANITGNIIQGNNVLKFIVTNMGLQNGTPSSNPAGLIYKFHIDGNCGDEYFQNHCELWQSTDLDGSQQFFNFDDIKPGDYGTNVISLDVSSNDAYVCLLINNVDEQENGIIDPETTAGDLPNVGNLNGFGELSPFIKVFAWNDTDNDGVYEGEATLLAPNTPIVDLDLLSLSLTGGSPTFYVGLAWCAGTQSVLGNVISCNGATMGDIAQTDSFTADLTAYAEQQRNNEEFDCESVELPVLPQ
ncbi:M73 family metallopeptidase [Patescibacteria group bacterium]|nr:M73 family metallopeptidase [Patescibacteria group bacterium]MBU1876817.1 M73 family metallopeptidase [Patescibacteria group bacterium]